MTSHKNLSAIGAHTAEEKAEYVKQERRSFLEMVGKAGIASSLLKSSALITGVMSARYATAAGGAKRVVFCYTHSGVKTGKWLPTSSSQMNQISKAFGPEGDNVAGLCRFHSVDVEVAGHGGARQALGNPSYGRTVDADLAVKMGATSPYSSILLGSNSNDGGTGAGLIITSAGTPQDDAREAVKSFFSAQPPSAAGDVTYERAFAAQYAAIDSIKKKLGIDEQARLQEHLVALKKIEDRIKAQQSNTGPDISTCKPTLPATIDDSTNPGMVAQGKLQADIIVAAFKCNLTNVAVLQVGNHQGEGWKFRTSGGEFNGHNTIHSAASGSYEKMQTEKYQIASYLLKRLTEEKDSTGAALIDSTAFVNVSCMGDGDNHNSAGSPFMLATKMSSFKTGFSSKNLGAATARDFHAAVVAGLGFDPKSGFNLGGADAAKADLV
jgi:hypothetical protein